MGVDSGKIRASVAAYFRYIRQCYIIAFEADHADILAVDEENFLAEVEVKISISDLRRDAAKSKHRFYCKGGNAPWSLPRRRFYFAVPKEIANKVCLACDNEYTYAGVLGTNGGSGTDVDVYRRARDLMGRALSGEETRELVKQQSGTLCRLAMKMNDIDWKYD